MVFFTCNACGESMKKNQVEKHYKFQCKRCEYLSCVDCSQEFWGDDYAKHTKCISEDAKYGGKDYKPKPNANKGERKQEEWTEKVQCAIDKCKSNPKLKALLEKMKDYSNIPRKKAKFENFVKNSLRIQAGLATQMWDAINVEVNNSQTVKNGETNGTVNTEDNDNKANNSSADLKSNVNGQINENLTDDKKLSKREKKEERKKNKNKMEKKDKKSIQVEAEEENSDNKKKKKKKRKHEEIEEEVKENVENVDESSEVQEKKKKKRKGDGDSEPAKKKSKKEVAEEDTDTNESVNEKKPKFNWESIIVGLLKKSEGNQLSIKKLRKKVLAEYSTCHAESAYAEEKLHAKFNKKINNNKKFKVHKEKITLKS